MFRHSYTKTVNKHGYFVRFHPLQILVSVLFVISIIVYLMWHSVKMVLSNDRGLDLTDEGLYLWAASASPGTNVYGKSWGWFTSILFRLTDADVSSFRTLGAVLLILSFCYLVVSITIKQRSLFLSSTTNAGGIVYLLTMLVTAASSSLLYYNGLLRTPSYNWLALFSTSLIVASAISYLSLLTNGDERPTSQRHRTLFRWITLALLSLGLLMSWTAKPSLPLMLTALLVPIFITGIGVRRSLRAIAEILLSLGLWVGFLLLVGLWPFEHIEMLWSFFVGPVLTDEHTLGSALGQFILVPKEFITQFFLLPIHAKMLYLVGLCALLLATFFFRSLKTLAILGFVLMVLSATLFGNGLVSKWLDIPWPVNGLVSPNTTTGVMVYLAAFFLTCSQHFSLKSGSNPQKVARRLLIGFTVACLPFVLGFGSFVGAYAMSSPSSGLLFVAAFITISPSLQCQRWRLLLPILVMASCVVTLIHTLILSQNVPYRIAPMASQTELIDLGLYASSQLFVERELANGIRSFQTQAEEAGFKQETPLLGMGSIWSATVGFILGTESHVVPMQTIFGFPRSIEMARYHLKDIPDSDLRKSWQIRTNPSAASDSVLAQIDEVSSIVEDRSGLNFPEDYECVASALDWQLWAPRIELQRVPDSEHPFGCNEGSFLSNYDTVSGWR